MAELGTIGDLTDAPICITVVPVITQNGGADVVDAQTGATKLIMLLQVL